LTIVFMCTMSGPSATQSVRRTVHMPGSPLTCDMPCALWTCGTWQRGGGGGHPRTWMASSTTLSAMRGAATLIMTMYLRAALKLLRRGHAATAEATVGRRRPRLGRTAGRR
jgi:hypothetical protein